MVYPPVEGQQLSADNVRRDKISTPCDTYGWHQEIGKIINCVDNDNFPQQLIESIACIVPFDMAAIFINRGRSSPLCIYESFPTPKAKSGIQNYTSSTYVLNPFYQAHLAGIQAGVYRIGDLAPDDFFNSDLHRTFQVTTSDTEEIGFVTKNWPKGLEELDIAIPLSESITAEVDIFSTASEGGFDESHIAQLELNLPIFCGAMRKYWSLKQHVSHTQPVDNRIDDLFENFGKPTLSNREQEVIQYVLKGHSSESIGYNLDISLTTVKTHRKRAYAKLAISSQSELLSLFLQSIDAEHRDTSVET